MVVLLRVAARLQTVAAVTVSFFRGLKEIG
jgi:hypothetical protein